MTSFKLPALRTLSELADRQPVVVIDTREQTPLPFTRLETVRGTLPTGDYSVAGLEDLISIERKSIADLTSCCVNAQRDRFERELLRLRGYRFRRLLIIGKEDEVWLCRYMSSIAPKAVMATLAAFEVRYDVPIVWAENPQLAALLVERWAYWFARETVETLNQLCRRTPARHFGQ